MTQVIFKDKTITLEAGQTVLSALLEHGYDIPHSCQAGACQTCLMQALSGDIPVEAQAGLKDTLKAQNYFLACCCKPTSPMEVALADHDTVLTTATVTEHTLLCTDVLRLRLKPDAPFSYHTGQYVTLWKDDNTARSYSLASVPALDDELELHIRRIPGGKVSTWLHDEIKTGDSVQIQDASGDCFYMPGTPEKKLLLAGTGTGLAPLIGIARDALQQGHKGEIHLIHGVKQAHDLYLHQTLMQMADAHSQFFYHASVLEKGDLPAMATNTPMAELTMQITGVPAEWNIFLCGDVNIVNTLKMKLFLAGASMDNIYTDPFIPAADG